MGNIPSILRYFSYKDIIDFALFRARLFAASKLNTGHLERRKNTVDLTFYDGTFRYVIRFPKKRGPCPFGRVYTNNTIDVTPEIKEFAGPCYNFYGIPTTPDMLGYLNLSFTMTTEDGNDCILEFSGDSEIVLSLPDQSLSKNPGEKIHNNINEPNASGDTNSGCDSHSSGDSKVDAERAS